MTYKELFKKVAATLPTNHAFNISVETWRHRISGVETKWVIYVSFDGDECLRADGNTAQEAFDAYQRELSDQEPLEATSAAVGDAQVDA